MKRRWIPLALGAALLTWGAAIPAAAQDKHRSHSATKQGAHGGHDKMMDRMMAGMSAAEKKHMHGHVAKMSAAERKKMMERMMRMSPAERRKMAQKMMKEHGAHGKSSGGGHAKPKSGKAPAHTDH